MVLGLRLPASQICSPQCLSESPSQKATLALPKGYKLTNRKIKQRESSDYPFQSANICLMMSVLMKAAACDCSPAPRPWKSPLDLVWMSASLRMRAARLSALLTTPLPRQLHHSCKHTAVTSTGCVGWAPRTWLESPDWQAGLASLHLPEWGGWLHPACSAAPDLLLLLEPDATFHELMRSSAWSQGGDYFDLRNLSVAQKCFHNWPKC